MLLKKEKQKKRKKKTEANCFKYCMRRTSRGGGDGWAGAEVGRAPVDGQLPPPPISGTTLRGSKGEVAGGRAVLRRSCSWI